MKDPAGIAFLENAILYRWKKEYDAHKEAEQKLRNIRRR